MKSFPVILVCFLLMAACGSAPETVRPGRGAEIEVGPMAKIYPLGEAARTDRHGLWRGMNGDQTVWEVRYTRGVPTGPYREWNSEGELVATWPYDWEGRISGWARWFLEGKPDVKMEITPEMAPDFDVVGHAAGLKEWVQNLSED